MYHDLVTMLRRLILLRHAKSDWKSGADTDHGRPLNARGRRDAPRIAAKLAELAWVPELVLSSDSARTRETWSLMAEPLGAPPVSFTEDLYLGDLEAIREAVSSVDAGVGCLMLIGHNPGWEDASTFLTATGVAMTTCNAAMMSLEADSWSAAIGQGGAWSLEHLLRPKEI